MITKEKLYKMCEFIIEGHELTTKELNNYGFTSKDLSKFIEQGVLNRTKRGLYSFVAFEALYDYGKKMKADKDHDKATKCFEKCYEIDPKHRSTNIRLFLTSIFNKDYDTAMKHLKELENTDNTNYKTDCMFYLYLLSFITDIPEEDKDSVRYLSLEYIKMNPEDKRYSNISLQNEIRQLALQCKFLYALRVLRQSRSEREKGNCNDIITETLLCQVCSREILTRNEIIEFINNKDYLQIISTLENQQERHRLNLNDRLTLELASQIVKMEETKQIPKTKIYQTESMSKAIFGHNYLLASRLSKKYNREKHINEETNPIDLLLFDINKLIYEISVSKSEPLNECSSINTDEDEQDEIQTSNTNDTINDAIKELKDYLIELDLDNAFISLKSYLNIIGKDEYELLFINLIRLSLRMDDLTFNIPIKELESITRDDFTFDVSSYIEFFNDAISQNNLDDAVVYLDIVKSARYINNVDVSLEELNQVIETSEQTLLNGQESIEEITIMDESITIEPENEDAITDLEEASEDAKTTKQSEVVTTEFLYGNDYQSDINNYHGIKHINRVTSYIMKSGLDVESACLELGMTEKQIATMQLIYAREYYYQGDYEKGDQFLMAAESGKNKEKSTINFINEIRKNKRFYSNRNNRNHLRLVLTLQPHKKTY